MRLRNDDGEFDRSEEGEGSWRTAIRTGKEAFFHLIYLCCPNPTIEHKYSHSPRSSLLFFAASQSLHALQLLSLLYPVPLSSWSSYSLWTTLITLLRFDAAAVRLGFQSAFTYTMAVGALVPLLLFAAMSRKLSKKPKRSWHWGRVGFETMVLAFGSVMFVPGMCAHLAAFKYRSPAPMFEYNQTLSASLLHPAIHYLSLVPLGLLCLQSLLSRLLIYDIFLTNAKEHITARAHSKIEALSLLCDSVATVSHFFLHQDSSFLFHYLLCICAYGTMVYNYFYYLPFYNVAMNWGGVMAYGIGMWGGVAVVVSYVVESAACGFLLTVLLPAATGPVLWDLINKRILYIQRTYSRSFDLLRNPYLGELCIRFSTLRYLSTHSSKPDDSLREFYIGKLAPLFNRHTRKFQNEIFPGLWEFAYLLSVVQDVNVARVKLTKTALAKFDLEGAFNQYRFQQMLSESTLSTSDESAYVTFRLQFDSAKQADELSCHLQLQFWSELSTEAPQPSRTESLAFQVNESLHRAMALLTRLVQNYPKSHLALRLYGSYLTEVMNDTEHGRELVSKSLYEESELSAKNLQMGKVFSYFDDSYGIVLVAGSESEVGTITYINQKAGEVLGVSERMAVGMNISNFIPPYICTPKQHNSAITTFLHSCISDVIPLPFGFFLQDISEFMVEVHVQIKPTSLDLKPFFLAAIKKELACDREICLIDEFGIVQTHTRGLPVLLGYSDLPVLCKNMSASALLNNYFEDISLRRDGEVFGYVLPHTVNEVKLRFVRMKIGLVSFRVLYATSNDDEADMWGNQAAIVQRDELSREIDPALLRKRTIKSILKRAHAPKKGLSIQFDLNPKLHYLLETDFPPCKSEYGKQKDAGPISVKKALSAHTNTEGSEKTVGMQEPQEILDLKDLNPYELSGNEDLSVDQQSRMSGALSELTDAKPKGQSLASSVMSSNSSFTSTKMAMDLLNVVNRSMKRFKYSFLLTNLSVILGVTAMLVYLIVSSDSYQSRLIVPELCDRRVLASALAFDAKNLLLIQMRRLPGEMETQVRARMQENLRRFDEIQDALRVFVEGLGRGEYRDLYLQEDVLTWELTGRTATPSFSNLLDVMNSFSLHSHSVLSTPLSSLNSSSSLFFLFRNGEGESLKAMNASTWIYIRQEQSSLSAVLLNIGIMGGLAFLLLIACFLAVIVPTVLAVDHSNQNIWSFFYKLPFDIVQDLRFHCEERLESVHAAEIEHIALRKTNAIEQETRAKIQCSRKWPYIYRRLWIYYFLSVGYGIYFYFAVYTNLGAMLLKAPEMVNLTGERTLSLQSSYLWLQETVLRDADAANTPFWQTSVYWSQPEQRLRSVLDHLLAVETSIMTTPLGHLGSSQSTDSLSISDMCELSPTSETCMSSVMARGLHSAITGYSLDSLHYSSQLVAAANSDLPLFVLLPNATRQLMLDYNSVLSQKIADKELEIELVTTLYCVVCLLFYFAVYLPMTSQVRTQLTNIWDLASLIPMELIERITRAMKKIEANKVKL